MCGSNHTKVHRVYAWGDGVSYFLSVVERGGGFILLLGGICGRCRFSRPYKIPLPFQHVATRSNNARSNV